MPLTREQAIGIAVKMRERIGQVRYTKVEVVVAVNAIEDWFAANRAALSTEIDTATAPFVFTNAEKKQMVAAWLLGKGDRERE